MTSEAVQVPLLEQLRSVPKDWREMREIDLYHHQNVPYGRMLHEAADEIEKLRRAAHIHEWEEYGDGSLDRCRDCLEIRPALVAICAAPVAQPPAEPSSVEFQCWVDRGMKLHSDATCLWQDYAQAADNQTAGRVADSAIAADAALRAHLTAGGGR